MLKSTRNRRRSILAAKRRKAKMTAERNRQPQLEGLEPRQLLTASVQFTTPLSLLNESATSGGPQLQVSNIPAATGLQGTAIQRTVFVNTSLPAPSPSVTPAEPSDFSVTSFELPLGFGKGSTSATVDVMSMGWLSVTNDQFVEGDETFNINIIGVGGNGSGIGNVGPQKTHQHIILDNEKIDSVAIQSNPIVESNTTHSVAVTMKLSSGDPIKDKSAADCASKAENCLPAILEPAGNGGNAITMTVFDVAGGSAIVQPDKDGKAPFDTAPIPNQTLTFPAGSGSGVTSTFNVTTFDDFFVEKVETVNFDFKGFSGTPPITFGNKVLKIADNESATVTLSKLSDTAFEDDANASFNTVQLNMSVPAGTTLAEDLIIPVTIGGSAGFSNTSSDYGFVSPPITSVLAPHNVKFNAGTGSGSVTFTIDAESGTRDDSLLEGNENVTLTLSQDTNKVASIFNAKYELVIIDDEAGKLTVTSGPDITEGGQATYTVKLDGVSGGITAVGPVTLSYSLSGTALPTDKTDSGAGDPDYNQAASGTVTLPFMGGTSSTATVTIQTIDDADVEGKETLFFNLQTGISGLPITVTDNLVEISDNDSAQVFINVTDGTGLEDKLGPGDKGNNDAEFAVSLTQLSDTDTTVTLAFDDAVVNDAVSGLDYQPLPVSVTIPAGKSSVKIPVVILDDNVVELTENIGLKITKVTAGSSKISIQNQVLSSRTLQIIDTPDTATISLTTSDPFAAEPSDNGQFLFSLSSPAGTSISIPYTISGTATLGQDHTLASGTATIPAGSLFLPIDVPVLDDSLAEGTETVTLTVGANSFVNGNVTLAAQSTSLNILDDEATAIVSVTTLDSSAAEGDKDNTTMKFKVSIPNATVTPVTVTLAAKGTATNGVDYFPDSSLTTPFNLGGGNPTSKEFTLTVTDDALVEGDETVILEIVSAVNGNIGNKSATATIIDNDNAKVNIVGVVNADENPGAVGRFDVSLSDASTTDTKVALTLSGFAIQNVDYQLFKDAAGKNPMPNEIVIPKGSTSSIPIYVRGIEDILVEGNETVIMTPSSILSGASSIGTGTPGTIRIIDNDTALVSIEATDGIAAEQNTPSDQGTYRVTVSSPFVVQPMTVQYTLISSKNPTADNSDVVLSGPDTKVAATGLTTGTFTINPGDTEVFLTVTAIDDALVEGVEDLNMLLTGIASTTLAGVGIDPQAQNDIVNILDNDKAEVFLAFQSLQDQEAWEPGDGGGDATVPLFVGLTQASSADTIVTFSVGAPGTPTADAEFGTGLVPGTIGADDFSVNGVAQHVFCPTGVAPCNPSGTLLPNPITGNYDFQVNIKAGTLFQIVELTALSDPVVEGIEFASVELVQNASSNSLYANSAALNSVTPMIRENDTAVVQISDHTNTPADNSVSWKNTGAISEGDPLGGGTEATIRVLSPVEGELGVTVIPINGSATTPADYTTPVQNFLFVNTGGNETRTVEIDAVNDLIFESTEDYSLTLAAVHNNAGNVDVDDVGTVQILDNDAISFSISNSVVEGKDGERTLNGTLSVNGTLPATTFNIFTTDGTALSTGGPIGANDYIPINGTAFWDGTKFTTANSFGDTNNNSVLSFSIKVKGDEIVEGDQNFKVTASAPAIPAVENRVQTITILDDDAVTVTANSLIDTDKVKNSVSEGAGISPPLTVSTNKAIEGTLTVKVNVADGTALASTNDAKTNNDYVKPGEVTLTFANTGPTTQTAIGGVTIHQDTIAEGDESFNVVLSDVVLKNNQNEAFSAVSSSNGKVTIKDDDSITFTVDPTSIEVTEATGTASFTVKLIPVGATTATVPIVINPVTSNGTATGGQDFTAIAPGDQPLTFTGLNQTRTVTVAISDDLVVEGGKETFSVGFPAANVNVVPGTSFALPPAVPITIVDSDAAVIEIRNEVDGREGGPNGSFDVGLSGGRTTDVDVFVSINVGGTAAALFDYSLSGTTFSSTFPTLLLTLPAGQNSITIPVAVVDDGFVEGTETVVLTENNTIPAQPRAITSPSSGSAADTGTVNIVDNDGVSSNPAPINVSISGTGWAVSPHSLTSGGSGTLPWMNLNRITVTYASAPTVTPNLILEGPSSGGVIPTVTNWTPGSTTATFTTFSSLSNGRYKATIDGGVGSAPISFAVLQGDAFADPANEVGFTDFAVFAGNFGATGGAVPTRTDFDGSGDTGFTDFAIFAGAFGTNLSPFVAPLPVVGQAEPVSALIAVRAAAQSHANAVDSLFADEADDEQEEIFDLWG